MEEKYLNDRDQLELVKKDGTLEPEKLFIDNGNIIAYYDERNEKQLVLNLESKDRPLYMSELFSIINNRRWHIPIRRVITSSEELAFCKTNFIEELTEDDSMDFENSIYIATKKTNPLKPASDEEIREFMENIYDNFRKSNLTLFNSSKIIVDILNSSVTLNLIDPDNYTDTVSLKEIETKTTKLGTSCKVDLSVSYSYSDGTIEVKDTSFTAFNYIGTELDTEFKRNNTIIKLGDVEVEYLEGIIKAIPINDKVVECIINNCIITYGSF